jgi:hypothetical protein
MPKRAHKPLLPLSDSRKGKGLLVLGADAPVQKLGGRSQPVHVDPGDQLEAGDGHHDEDLEDQGGSLHHAVTRL